MDIRESGRSETCLFFYVVVVVVVYPPFSPDRTAAHKDVCFLLVDEGSICSEPRKGMVVTYSECCCHYGRGWGPECNTCPSRNSGKQAEDLRSISALASEHSFTFLLS